MPALPPTLARTPPSHPGETALWGPAPPGPQTPGVEPLPVRPQLLLCLSGRSASFWNKDAVKGREKRQPALSQETPEGRDRVSPPDWGFPGGRGGVSLLSLTPLQARPFPWLDSPGRPHLPAGDDWSHWRPHQGGATSPAWPSPCESPCRFPSHPPGPLGFRFPVTWAFITQRCVWDKMHRKPWPSSQKFCEASMRHLL